MLRISEAAIRILKRGAVTLGVDPVRGHPDVSIEQKAYHRDRGAARNTTRLMDFYRDVSFEDRFFWFINSNLLIINGAVMPPAKAAFPAYSADAWLLRDVPHDRVRNVLSAFEDIIESDLTPEFKAALVNASTLD